jgi:hypothetical protein
MGLCDYLANTHFGPQWNHLGTTPKNPATIQETIRSFYMAGGGNPYAKFYGT